MNTRAWLNLSRKLVDRNDLNYSFTAVQQALGEYALALFGEGVVITSQYPNPFPITLSGSMVLGGSVRYGIAFDKNGQLTNITPTTTGSPNFVLPAADPTNTRFDLLCLRYLSQGDTPIPKPSDPLTTIFLNLHDDFQLVVVPGTPSGTPSYPSKSDPLLIVLSGIQVPPGATMGIQCTIDYSVREQANKNLAVFPVIVSEIPTGLIDGTNAVFNISQSPVSNGSLILSLDGLTLIPGRDYSILGQVLTLSPAPTVGQTLSVWYLAQSVQSQNPLAGVQEPAIQNSIDPTVYDLTGKPANQQSTLVFIDGLEVPLSGWNLIQKINSGSIQFNANYTPTPGQQVSAFYLANPFVFGNQPPPVAPPSGSGLLRAFGSSSSPQIITPTSGIPATADARQLWITASSGGVQTITAVPQISPGTTVGQELDVQGISNSDYIILTDGNGLSLNGAVELTKNGSISLIWNGSIWNEQTRR